MDLHEVTVGKIIREVIDKFIYEDRSISNDVRYVTNSITDELCNGNLNFTYDFFNIGEWNIVGTIVNEDKINGKIDASSKTIYFEVPMQGDEVLKDVLRKTVQHEVEHVFQISKLSDTDNGTNKSYNILYNIALKQFNDPNSSYADREIARYVYCCSTLEQDAFVNELYADLTNSKVFSKDQESEIYIGSEALKVLTTIQDVRMDIIENGKNVDYQDAAKKYNKPIRWFIYLGNNAERRMKRKIRNVFLKAREDRLKKITFPNINLDSVTY